MLKTRKRRVLSRDKVLLVAAAMIEKQGIEALSMRKLAAELGVEAMSLYNHVRNKDELIDGVIETALNHMKIADPSNDWRADLRSVAEAFRAVAIEYPNIAALMLTRQVFTESAVAATGTMLKALNTAGFEVEEAVYAARSILAYVIGSLLREVHPARPEFTPDSAQLAAREQQLIASHDPMIIKAAPYLARPASEAEYHFGLDLLLDALSRRAADVGV